MKPLSATLVTAPLLAMFLANAADAAEPAKPNIVVILVDDVGFCDIGCYGSEIPTPNLDRLAAEGVRFTQFYNTGRCCPTRASLLTGLYPHQAGVGHMNEDKNGWDQLRAQRHAKQIELGIVDKAWPLSPRPGEVKAWGNLSTT